MNAKLLAELRVLLRTEPRVRRELEREVENRRARARLEALVAVERERICVVCGNACESENPKRRTCSDRCRQKAHRERRRAARYQAPEAIAA